MLREVAEDLKFLVTRKEKTIRLPTCWVKSGIVTFAKMVKITHWLGNLVTKKQISILRITDHLIS